MQYLLKQSEMENKWKKQKGENPSIDQNCNQQKEKSKGGGEESWGSGEKQNIVKQSWRKTSRAKQQLARPQKSDKDDGKNQQTGNNRKSPGTPPSRLFCDASGRWLNKVRQDCATNRGRDSGRRREGVATAASLLALCCVSALCSVLGRFSRWILNSRTLLPGPLTC